EKQVSLFISLIGNKGYELLFNLCTPKNPANLTLEHLAEIMQKHLQPQSSVISQRYEFKECKQMEGEDIKTYLPKLKKISTHCQFGEQWEIHIRDQFVRGRLAGEKIRKKLLEDQQLTYTKTMEISTSIDMAVREAADMRNAANSKESEILWIRKRKW
ncbi:hypothetical protein ALC56_00247, partial [Trachymyrmex septentrionalis]